MKCSYVIVSGLIFNNEERAKHKTPKEQEVLSGTNTYHCLTHSCNPQI